MDKQVNIVLTLFIIFFFANEFSFACKNLIYPKNLPPEVFSKFSDIYLAKVIRVSQTGHGNPVEEMFERSRPFNAELQVIKAFKGNHKVGENFEASTDNQEAQARCP